MQCWRETIDASVEGMKARGKAQKRKQKFGKIWKKKSILLVCDLQNLSERRKKAASEKQQAHDDMEEMKRSYEVSD